MVTIGFLINPIAGMGGSVGLKGTDGKEVLEKAKELGSKPVSPTRALKTLEVILRDRAKQELRFITCAAPMGADVLQKAGFKEGADFDVVHQPKDPTTSDDTKAACRKFLEMRVTFIVFAGGDGTAHDVFSTVDKKVPVLGIPSGVKMHSSVFALNPQAASEVILAFADGSISNKDAEIMDIDEDAYRKGTLDVHLFGYAVTPYNDRLIQTAKAVYRTGDEDAYKQAIARFFGEMLEKESGIYFLGAGSTIQAITEHLGIEHTVLGVDALRVKKDGKRELLGKDLNEKDMLDLLSKNKKEMFRIVISPIGAQGFLFGRGNQQFSPEVIKRVGVDNIIIISTPHKLENTPTIYVDTGDDKLDDLLVGFRRVIIGYHSMAMRRVEVPAGKE